MKFVNTLSSIALGFALVACAPSGKAQTPANTETVTDTAKPEPLIMGQTYSVKSTVLDMDRRLTVRLPSGYAKSPDKNYPVVYIIDGGPEQDFPHIAGIAQSREVNGTFAPFILVGIETVNRRYQITPPARDMKSYKKELGTKPGGSADFRTYIREDVMPWVNAKYRTNDQDAVIGESLGGLFIVETFLKDPTLFDDYIAVSPSMWWDEMKLGSEAAADLAAMPAGKRRLYLTMADEAVLMQEGLDKLIAALEIGAPEDLGWTYVERKNSEGHASIYHVAALDAFRALYLEAARTGGGNPATFKDGKVPKLTKAVKKNLKKPCTRENAVSVSFSEKNKDPDKWRGMCVIMKPGDTATKGNLDY